MKLIAAHIIQPLLKFYLKKERTFLYKGLKFTVLPGVFHPLFFFSSKYLSSFIDKLKISGKKVYEPCCGSGFISINAAANGAIVTCSDIDPKAVENTKLNLEVNRSVLSSNSLNVLLSDCFENIPAGVFDIIAVNPPYFFKAQKSPEQLAWNCGENGEFFAKFFSKLGTYTDGNSHTYMVLAENCDINRIKDIANSYNFNLKQVDEKKILWEKNFIFQVEKI